MPLLERIAAWIFGLAFLGLAAAVATETFSRKVFNKSLQGVDELGGYLLAVGAALSFAVALIGRTHIRIDLIHDLLPRALRVALNILAVALILVAAVAVTYMAWIALSDSILFNATAQTPWATPLRIPQAAWVAALGVFVLVAALQLAKVLGLLVAGRIDALDRHHGPRGAKEELADELADIAARGAAAAAQVPVAERRP
jgi:TRAP-type C4-dicarboxylate transport system permease small subunit